MADDKEGREKQARDADNRQRQREIKAELERGTEPEPPVAELSDVEANLDAVEFPATGDEIVASLGDREIQSDDGTYTIEELVPETDDEVFDSPTAVRVAVQRPTVAAAMKQIIEAGKTLQNSELSWSQRKAYEMTFQELQAIEADDDDEGIQAICDWIVEHITTNEKFPSSRNVRRHAAKFCRTNGYTVRDDEWLGI